MSSNSYIILFLFLIFPNALTEDSQWIDPFEMSLSSSSISDTTELSSESLVIQPIKPKTESSHVLAYYTRTINLLLNSLKQSGEVSGKYTGHVFIDVSQKQYELLKRFARESNEALLQDVDVIITDIFTKSTKEHLEELLFSWFEYFAMAVTNRTSLILVAGIVFLFVMYKLTIANFTLKYLIKYLVVSLLIIDFVWTWFRLYQEEEIDKMANAIKYEGTPVHCDPRKMSTWQLIWSSLGTEDECKNYYQAVYRDVFWSVSPTKVIAEMFKTLILHPARGTGQALGELSTGIISSIPFWYRPVLLPVLLIFFAVMICIVLSFVTGVQISFNLFHLFSLKFGGGGRSGDVDRHMAKLIDIAHKNSTTQEKMVTIMHTNSSGRVFVEEIREIENNPGDGEDIKAIELNSSKERDNRIEKNRVDEKGDK